MLIGGKAGGEGERGGSQWSGGKKKRRRGFPLCSPALALLPACVFRFAAASISFTAPRPHPVAVLHCSSRVGKENTIQCTVAIYSIYSSGKQMPLVEPQFFLPRYNIFGWLPHSDKFCHAFRELMFGSLSNFQKFWAGWAKLTRPVLFDWT
jgi:hypothetical protein